MNMSGMNLEISVKNLTLTVKMNLRLYVNK